MTQTKLADLVNPEVMADMLEVELKKQIRFLPLAEVDTTLVAQPGSILTFPKWKYIGDAKDIPEGEPIPLEKMNTESAQVEVKKAGKGVEITDEAVLSGLGDPIGEAARQLVLSIAQKVDNDILDQARQASQHVDMAPTTVEALQSAIDVFSDEDDKEMSLVLSPVDAGKLRSDAQRKYLFGTETGAETVVKGAIGEILGVQIIRSNKLEKGEAYLIKQGAIKLALKRDVLVESDRDIVAGTTVMTANQHYAGYLYNETKVVKIEGEEPSGGSDAGGENPYPTEE